MKDGDIVRIARKIDALKFKIDDLLEEIANSDHPYADRMMEELYQKCWFGAWATHVIHSYLEAPDRWETGDYGIRRKTRETK